MNFNGALNFAGCAKLGPNHFQETEDATLECSRGLRTRGWILAARCLGHF